MEKAISLKEERIRKITQLYYSQPKILDELFKFSKDREVVPRYFDEFGKRPDSPQYKDDIFQLIKKGATSFHCSQELWYEPLKLSTELNEKQLNELRKGWDLLIDIDSKYIDYSKIYAEIIVKFLKFHGIKNLGVKFSGSKGFHIIIPWKSFPKEVNKIKTAEMFPEWPRIICKYIMEQTKEKLIEKISSLSTPSQYIKDYKASEQVVPDIILVSPRHLFRMPYSLHEKTALASIVIDSEKISDFQLKDAEPMSVKIKEFIPDAKEAEASELLIQALDWHKHNNPEEQKESKVKEFQNKPLKLSSLSEINFPPAIQKILKGLSDGRKRALFILINFFRSIGLEKQELEKRIDDWNKKNEVPLKEGYIKTQIIWSYRNKLVPPPNYDKDYYKGIGIIPTQEELNYKNPVNYTIKKIIQNKAKNKDNFKNNR